ncbi:MAG: AAA family ATPase [Methanomassiliicoccales archaeon]|jgi:KaiC/GvpD/RAD55 family RecA-like ATPase|nr:AAA family ATPase [Methanomassiliicoccales archaeon]NYT14782.1 AAA family ATPase [Methanomassiliicoccales archaeon]
MDLQIERLRTYIQNFDENLQGGIPKGQVVLLTGTPGTMKSSLAYSILYQNALENRIPSVYMTLEQSRENLLQQMAAMGMDDERAKEYVHVLDLGLIRKSLTQLSAKGTWLQVFKMYADSLRHSLGYEILVVDSLDVLEMAAQMNENRRSELFYLFEWLRNLGVTSLLVSENQPDRMFEQKYDEGYLADGVVSLKLQEIGETDIQRRIRAVKLRSTNHKTGYFSLLFNDGKFSATQVITE